MIDLKKTYELYYYFYLIGNGYNNNNPTGDI